jgi:hypothetical protein
MKLRPKNWTRFQHYKDRRPPWIKLYRSLLDDRAFMCLPVASKALAPMLWLLASDHENGEIHGEMADIAFKLRMTEGELSGALKPLISNGMFEDASNMLATCLQPATPETERETETETEKSPLNPPVPGGKTATKVGKQRKAVAHRLPDDWGPQPAHHALADELGVVLFDELMKFRDYFLGEGKVKADWNRTFNNWLRTAAERKSRINQWSNRR